MLYWLSFSIRPNGKSSILKIYTTDIFLTYFIQIVTYVGWYYPTISQKVTETRNKTTKHDGECQSTLSVKRSGAIHAFDAIVFYPLNLWKLYFLFVFLYIMKLILKAFYLMWQSVDAFANLQNTQRKETMTFSQKNRCASQLSQGTYLVHSILLHSCQLLQTSEEFIIQFWGKCGANLVLSWLKDIE